MEYDDLVREKEAAVEDGSRLSIENEDLIEAHTRELQATKEKFETDLVCPFDVGL